jgi:hypothetical protein
MAKTIFHTCDGCGKGMPPEKAAIVDGKTQTEGKRKDGALFHLTLKASYAKEGKVAESADLCAQCVLDLLTSRTLGLPVQRGSEGESRASESFSQQADR